MPINSYYSVCYVIEAVNMTIVDLGWNWQYL